MAEGFVKFDRKIENWGWYKNVNTFKLFFHLVTFANYTPGEFEGITIERGQMVASYRTLSLKTGLSERQIRTALNHLKSTGEVTHVSHPKFSLFTVVNYDKYQSATQTLTGERHTTDTGATGERQQYKNNKNNKKERNNTPPPAPENDTLKNRTF